MDSLQKRMQEMNREAQRQRLNWPLINARREAITELTERIKPASAAEIVPQVQALVARVEAKPWGPGCPKPMALSTAIEEVKSLLTFGGKTLSQQIRDLLGTTFTDDELSEQFCDSFSTFKNLSSCVIAAPGALRKLKTVIKYEMSELEGRRWRLIFRSNLCSETMKSKAWKLSPTCRREIKSKGKKNHG